VLAPVGLLEVAPLRPGESVTSAVTRGTVAVDGERELEFGPATPVTVTLTHDGPTVLDVRAALAHAAEHGLLVSGTQSSQRELPGGAMKAARYHGRGRHPIDEVPEPEPGPDQVKVAVDWCGICGSDLHEFLEGHCSSPSPAHRTRSPGRPCRS